MRSILALLAASVSLTGCMAALAASEAPAEPGSAVPELTTRHTSVYNRIDYLIPDGWVVIDGETDWIAPRMDLQEGHAGYDPELHPTFSAAVILPYLSVRDVQQKRQASLEGLARATLAALFDGQGAIALADPSATQLGGKPAWIIRARMRDGRILHQAFVSLPNDQVGFAAAVGPANLADRSGALVESIAATIAPQASQTEIE